MNFEEWWIEFEKVVSKFSDENFIFRGQADKKWELKTSFQREKEENKNYNLITAIKDFEIFLAKEGEYPFEEKKDIYEWLRLGQHYGLATPYLDFSKSPYISLFFASSDELKKDGKLFILDIDKFLSKYVEYLKLEKIEKIINKYNFSVKFNETSNNSLKEKLKNNTSIIEAFIEYVEELEIEKNKRIKNEKHEIPKNIEIGELELLNLLKDEFKKEIEQKSIVEDEIFFYLFLDSYNNRMKRQQGCFLYYNMEKSQDLRAFIKKYNIQILNLEKNFTFEKDKVLYEIIIPVKYKKDILNKLNKMNISNVTLFGDEEYAVKDAKLGLEHNLKVKDSKIDLKGKI